MVFEVTFSSIGNGSAAMFGAIETGLRDLDFARSLVRSNIPATLLPDVIDAFMDEPTIEIEEDDARKSGYFLDCHAIAVDVPATSLNRFYRQEWRATQRDRQSGEVTQVASVYVLDEEAVIAAWVAAGYPLRWELGEEEAEDEQTVAGGSTGIEWTREATFVVKLPSEEPKGCPVCRRGTEGANGHAV